MADDGIDISARVSLDDLADQVVDAANSEAVIAFIKAIDAKVQDWDFTLELWRYFDSERQKFLEETKAVADSLGGAS